MKYQRFLTFVVPFCFISFNVAAGNINYEGSSTVGKFITDATEVYKASTFKVDVVSESSGGEQCVMRKKCDMGGVAREVEQRFLDDEGVVATLIAKDAIAAIVNQNNPISELTTAQLKDIFTGKIKNWSELGGDDLPISAYVVKEASATRTVFAKFILGEADYQGVDVMTPDAKMVTTVAREKGAIGQISFAFLQGKKGIKPLNIDGQEATVENMDYLITRPLYITTLGEPKGEIKAFLDWTLSPDGQQVVKQRFVGVK
jgi:phosphate transport system substrate-binding protein